MSIYVPSKGVDSWRPLLADPEKHWRAGYSAMTLAASWESARGLPPEISSLLPEGAELLIGLPEHKVDLPGGRPTQADLFALVRAGGSTISLAIEGKVDEPFGPTLGEWLEDASHGKLRRLAFLYEMLGLSGPVAPQLRYQLFHRTAAAIIEAGRFKTDSAAMIVHSFSNSGMWFNDFAAFVGLFGIEARRDSPIQITLPSGRPLLLGWATGDADFLTAHPAVSKRL